MKASDFLTPDEIKHIKWVKELFHGKVTNVKDIKEESVGAVQQVHKAKTRR